MTDYRRDDYDGLNCLTSISLNLTDAVGIMGGYSIYG